MAVLPIKAARFSDSRMATTSTRNDDIVLVAGEDEREKFLSHDSASPSRVLAGALLIFTGRFLDYNLDLFSDSHWATSKSRRRSTNSGLGTASTATHGHKPR